MATGASTRSGCPACPARAPACRSRGARPSRRSARAPRRGAPARSARRPRRCRTGRIPSPTSGARGALAAGRRRSSGAVPHRTRGPLRRAWHRCPPSPPPTIPRSPRCPHRGARPPPRRAARPSTRSPHRARAVSSSAVACRASRCSSRSNSSKSLRSARGIARSRPTCSGCPQPVSWRPQSEWEM